MEKINSSTLLKAILDISTIADQCKTQEQIMPLIKEYLTYVDPDDFKAMVQKSKVFLTDLSVLL